MTYLELDTVTRRPCGFAITSKQGSVQKCERFKSMKTEHDLFHTPVLMCKYKSKQI